jgi:hypothetical protein
LFPRPGTAGEPDSLSAPPSLAAAGDTAAASPPHVTVELKSDSMVVVAVVAWRSDGFLLVVHPNGSETVIGSYTVRKILDGTGVDRTRFVVDKHGAVGTLPPTYQGHIDPAEFQEKPNKSTGGVFGFLGGMVGVVVLGLALIVVLAGDWGS